MGNRKYIGGAVVAGAVWVASSLGRIFSYGAHNTNSKDIEGQTPMAGTIEGGKRAAATNKALYGDDYYARIGRIGGHRSRTGGFYANRELAKVAGAKGGRVSRRGSKTKRGNPANE